MIAQVASASKLMNALQPDDVASGDLLPNTAASLEVTHSF
jgi:hypothetical protein